MPKKVALVSVCHNHLDVTKKFMESVLGELYAQLGSKYELYILDNGSSDNTYEYLLECEKNNKSFVHVYKSDINLGFAGGNNLLINEIFRRNTECLELEDYSNIILINNDTLITKKAIDKLVEVCNSDEEIAATGPISNSVGGMQLSRQYAKIKDNQYKEIADIVAMQNRKPIEAGMLVGFCLCIKTKVVKEIGLLDEQFGFGMWEDNDYCLRMRNAGYRLYVVPNSLIYHYGSQTIQDFSTNNLLEENKYKFLAKYKTSKYQNIVALCRVKNGGEIFKKCLTKVSSMVDTVIVFDDNSTDNTGEIAQKFANVVYHKSEWTTLDEARDRQWLLDKARELKADWCWIMDHDELPEDKLCRDIRKIVENANPEKDLFSFKVCHLWNSEEYFRTDGLWGSFWQGRLFRVRKQNVIKSNKTAGDANYHCSAHGYIPQQCIQNLPYKVLHYGNMDASVRLKKYLWYTANDKEKDINKVLGGYYQYYCDLYAKIALKKGEIENLSDYQFSPKDAYRHIVNEDGLQLAKVQDNKIALSMIVKNEKQYIRKCLESVKDLVDGMFIVDTGSTDCTKIICEEYTKNIYDFQWNDNFSDARNFALSKVGKEYNWILRLDGDEELPSKDLISVYNTVENGQADIFIFPIINVLQIKPFKTVLSKTARLFRNLEGITFTGIVHEEIDESVRKLNLKVSNFGGHLVHYGYLKNANTLDNKFKFYEKLALKEIEKDPNNFKPYYNLASHYCYLRDYDKATELYSKSLALNDKSYMIWHDYAVACYFKLLKDNQAQINAIEKLFLKAESLMPKDEFGEYRDKLNLNLKKIKELILK